jgi:hypothetical protein
MVGVHRLQALQASHDASALSQVQTWVHWPQAPTTFLIAALIGWLSLLWGFHHKGRPFGSLKAAMQTVLLIVVTALIAALLSILVPHLPFSLGIFIPALLCGAVLKENETIQEMRIANADLAAFVTIGISYFLKRAGEQISEDRTVWCETQMDALKSMSHGRAEDESASLGRFAAAARELRPRLDRRVSKDLQVQVKEQFTEVTRAVKAARQAHDGDEFSDEYDNAGAALFMLLQIAYNWKLANLSFAAAPNLSDQPFKPPERPSRPSEQSSKPPEQHKVG